MSQPVNSDRSFITAFYDVMKQDREKYRNHVYRVFLNCLMLDPDVQNEENMRLPQCFTI